MSESVVKVLNSINVLEVMLQEGGKGLVLGLL